MNTFSVASEIDRTTVHTALALISYQNNTINDKYYFSNSKFISILEKSQKKESIHKQNVKLYNDVNSSSNIFNKIQIQYIRNLERKGQPKITEILVKRRKSINYRINQKILFAEKLFNGNVLASNSPKSFFKYLIMLIFLAVFALSFLYYYKINKIKKQMELVIQEKDMVIELKQKQIKTNAKDSFAEVLEFAKNNDPAFLIRFQEVYPEFCASIKMILPDITQNELHFCGFLKLKFSTKDIAEYQFVTPKAIQNRKNKLRKRLNLDPKTDLYEFLDSFN